MFDRILLPLDGSSVAEAAIPFAARIPSREVMLFLIEPISGATSTVSDPAAPAPDRQGYLEAIAALLRQDDRRIVQAVEYGEPAELIVDAARAADLIVMATDGRGVGGRLVCGSYADRVARHAPAPTMLIRGGPHAVANEAFGRIVVTLDGSPGAEAALPDVVRLASVLGLPLHLLRVADPDQPIDDASVSPAAATDSAVEGPIHHHAQGYVEATARRLETGAHVTWAIRVGDPATEIMGELQTGDLLVITTHGGGGMRRWFMGNVAEQLVRRAPAPVLIAREAMIDTVPVALADAATTVWW